MFLEVLDAGASGGEDDVGFSEGFFAAFVGVGGIGGDDLAEEAVDFGLQWSERDAGFDAADDVEPLGGGVVDVVDVHEGGHGFDGHVVVGWGAGEAVAVETFRCDAGNDDGFGIDPEGAADDRGVAGVVVLPVFVADDGD